MQHIFNAIESQPEEILCSLMLSSYICQRDMYGMTEKQAATIFTNHETLEKEYQKWLKKQ